MIPDREYWTCRECSYGVSGDPHKILKAIDKHEQEEGHHMELVDETR